MAQPACRDRLVWSADGSIDVGDVRYLIIRPDFPLMGLFGRLDEGHRQAVLEALGQSVAEHGRKSMLAEMRRRNLDGAGFYHHLASAGPSQLGWGHWHYARPAEDRIEVTVDNSPFAHGIGSAAHPVCAPIAGMLTAIWRSHLPVRSARRCYESPAPRWAMRPHCKFVVQRALHDGEGHA